MEDEIDTLGNLPDPSINPTTMVSGLVTHTVKQLLDQIHIYDFPIFDFAEATMMRPLAVMSYQLVVESGLLSRLNLSRDKFMHFMVAIESGYRSSLTCT